MIWLLVFFLSAILLIYSYLLYPELLRWLARGRKQNSLTWERDDDLPYAIVLFSAFNEEKVIAAKIESVLNSRYPQDKIRLVIGSDNSTDQTDEIIRQYARQDRRILLQTFPLRQGKSSILNALVSRLQQELPFWKQSILILTDANVLFTSDTLFQLVKHFRNERIGQVGAHIQNCGMRQDGISYQEVTYIKRENQIKYYEGLIWGTMMGAFGACYAIRPSCWKTIPPNFLVEDFFLSMHVLASGYQAIHELQAICYEDVSNEVSEELRRKTRIQAGNFQNLWYYRKMLWRFNAVSFCFFSHKVIRWFGPLLLLMCFISNLALVPTHGFFQLTLLLQCLLFLSPLADYSLKQAGINNFQRLRLIAYFYAMNYALLKGMWVYLRGMKSNVWSPTRRNV
jgi:cellulose synthase/poly-beta-1,6-N-acetylglucosamine synthase-like glycosyltransferase